LSRATSTTMASDEKKGFYDGDTGSPTGAEPVATGHVSRRRGLPGFSWEVRQEESSFAATKNASNADFDPIPPSKRTWTTGAYVAYWMADAWAVSNWEVGESLSMSFTCQISECEDAENLLRSFVYDCCGPRLENGHWSLCAG
jgi:hypothetical protein